MSPTRTYPNGPFRFDRVFKGVGRIQVSSGTKTLAEFRKRDSLLSRLYDRGRLDLLQNLKDGHVTAAELANADRLDQLGHTTGDLVIRRPLWDAVNALLPTLADGAKTTRRYRYSLDKLAQTGVLPASAKVADLRRVDWRALERAWDGSAADWNHLARAVSRFLTVALGDVYHPFRREVVKLIPRRRERHRVPDVSAADFLQIVAKAPRELRPAYWTIVLTLLRPPSELLALTREDLLTRSHEVRIRASKTETDESDRVVPVSPRLWRWIDAAVPVTVTEWQLRHHWKAACGAAGRRVIRLYDLRHVGAQMLADAGRSQAAVGRMLGHAAGSKMTGRYTDRVLRREDAEALADQLVPQVVPQTRRKVVKR